MTHKIKSTILKICIILLLAAVIFYGALKLYEYIYEEYEKKLYPLPEEYLSVMKEYSKEYDVPIYLVAGVINTESSFTPDAVSNAGAKGIMQITDETFEWLNFKRKESHSLDLLFDYKTNIEYGTYFLSLLYEEFGNWDTAIAAYNAGLNRVKGWLEDEKYSENGVLKNIPYKETENYVKKVNKAAEYYKTNYFTQQ